mgnify:CR=1 FL=1
MKKVYRYSDFTAPERKRIEVLGRDTYLEFKKADNINIVRELLQKYNPSLELHLPSEDYIEKNITDIEWVLDGPGKDIEYWTKKKREDLRNIRKELLENEIVLYHEQGEWSLVNLFDNNVKLWIDTINYMLNEDPKFIEDLNYNDDDFVPNDRLIDVFFNYISTTPYLTFAQVGFLRNILVEFDTAKEVVLGTYTRGSNFEDEFITFAKKKFGEDNVKVFSSKGGVIDMTGVDLCIYEDGKWQPVQVKSTKSEAERNVPKGGFSIYKKGNVFYKKKDSPISEI